MCLSIKIFGLENEIFGTYLAFILWIAGIYVNRNVRLDDIQVYGFDYDYTLAHYSEHLQSLIYDLAKKHLVNEVSCQWSFVSAVVG